jgi:hypothetical protein
MSTLTDFLKEQAERLAQPDIKTQLDRWIQSEQRLIRDLEQWLKEADPQSVLKMTKANHELREEKFGSYSAVHRMTIDLGGRRVEIVPRGGSVGGVIPLEDGRTVPIHGLVDMTNDIGRYRLYRIPDNAEGRWFIKHESWERAKSLERSIFEAAMVHLLK